MLTPTDRSANLLDRALGIAEKDGLSPTGADDAPVVLDANCEPILFLEDAPTSAPLLAGEIIELNGMTRRGRFEHCLRRIREPAAAISTTATSRLRSPAPAISN